MADDQGKSQDDVDKLLQELGISEESAGAEQPTSETPASGDSKPAEGSEGGGQINLEQFIKTADSKSTMSVETLKDVNLHLKVELGRSRMYVQDILKLTSGSIIELDKLTGDPLDIYVNERLVARGEILVINDNFALRITEIVNPTRN